MARWLLVVYLTVILICIMHLIGAAASTGNFATLMPWRRTAKRKQLRSKCPPFTVGAASAKLQVESHARKHRKTVLIDGASASFNAKFGYRVDGNFTGATDEIIQWGACKCGFDEDITRARAVEESYWRQSTRGDKSNNTRTCNLIGKTAPCWRSYGLLQVMGTQHKGTYPLAEQSAAFNVDYALAWLRACYEGAFIA
jgi:hypothetical protein